MTDEPLNLCSPRRGRGRQRSPFALLAVLVVLLIAGLLSPAAAAAPAPWLDAAWPLRRPLDVEWAAERATGDEIVVAEFYTGGAHRPDGSDIRIATAAGQLLPARVLMVGPGDRVRVAFLAVRNERRYYAYFGNPTPPPQKPEMTDVPRTAGLLMEMRELATDRVNGAQEIEKAWQTSQKVIGRALIDHASLGVNPFGAQQRTISRFEGTFPVGFDGEYVFALSADDRAAVFIDGKPVIYSADASGDVRVNASVALKAGKHALVLYHVNLAGDGRFATAVRRAETERWQALSSEVLGRPLRATAGPLEERGRAVVADFAVEYEGEAFFADGYSHRYQFTAHPPAVAGPVSYAWDFGNGQTATAASVTQVYLADGEYAVKLTVRAGNESQTRVHRISVHRDWEWTDRPTEEPIARHALIVAGGNLAALPPRSLGRAAQLFVRTEKLDEAVAAGLRLASASASLPPAEADAALAALSEAADAASATGQAGAAVKLWQSVPPQSPLQPRASAALAQVQLWRQGDIRGAVKSLAGRADGDALRTYGQALVLSGDVPAGRRVLEGIQPKADPARRAAISGASARTVEFYITTADAEAGEAAWDLWQQRYPTDFLQGYAVLLKVQLMELRQAPAAAANIAEAFARAMPESAYSPQLLDRASRLLEKLDPPRSAAVRKLLKSKYPEDPLAQ